MTDSILSDIKKLLGIDSEYKDFDVDITIHINSIFSILDQVMTIPGGVVFKLEDGTETWDQFIKDKEQIGFVRSYIYTRVKLLFDPPTTSFGIAATERMSEEFVWRLSET